MVKSCRILILFLLSWHVSVKLSSLGMRSPEEIPCIGLDPTCWYKVCVSMHIIDASISDVGPCVKFVRRILVKDYSISSINQILLFSFVLQIILL